MKKVIWFALFLTACGNQPPNVDPLVQQYIQDDTLQSTVIHEDESKAATIPVDKVAQIDSSLFERSIFRDLGCARDFWFDKKGPECCCEDVLTNYAEVIKTMSVKRIAALNVKDPIIKKCRLKMKNWGKRFDEITNPPEDPSKKVSADEDEGI